MTRIISVVDTYNDKLEHDGHFIITDNYPMKWASRWQWDKLTKIPSFKLNLDKHLQILRNV